MADKLIQERNILHENWITFETAYSMMSPALEAEFAHDERSPLGLYDCVIPRLREYRRLQIRPELYFSQVLQDLKTQERIRATELRLEHIRYPKVEAERRYLAE